MKQPLRRLGSLAVLLLGFCFFCVAISVGDPGAAAIPGFSASRVEAEQELEQRLMGIPDPARAESDLKHLTSEPHMAGTEASHRVAEWLRDQYRSFGFDVEIATYSVWLPQPREVKLELTAPEHRDLATPEAPVEQDPGSYDKRAVIGFNAFSPSGEVSAPVVYVNYGMQEDYRELDSLGISVEGKIVIARYGIGFRGIKAKLAEEHKAVGLIIYSDPQDDGYTVGDTFPHGPWRPMSGIQRGSVLYTEIYPGGPLTPGVAATPGAKRLSPESAANLPHIPTMPINAKDAAVILGNLGGRHVPRKWQGALPFTYHIGPGDVRAHMKLVMDYQRRPIYDVIAKLHGTSDDQWVVLGNHHDAWVFGAADPGSGTASMLEAARALGDLVRSGWRPRRTIVMCEWDAEEPGLIGSTEWVEANRDELQSKAVAYINTDVGVTGPNFGAAATPSLWDFIRDVTRQVQDPMTGGTVYDAWCGEAVRRRQEASGTARQAPKTETADEAPLGELGAGSDFSPFFDYAGIPSMDIGFGGDYGVYHSIYDDFYWMKHFGDPSFAYHAALARVLGVLALRLDEADILPFDYSVYASEITRAETALIARAARHGDEVASLKPVADASAEFSAAAAHASRLLRAAGSASFDPAGQKEINRDLVDVEESLLDQDGLQGRPWFKHTIFAPGTYAGYAAELMPGVRESLDQNDPAGLRTEANAVAAALRRAATRLDEIADLAQKAAPFPVAGR
jgi:N-acetylated-alpha-linked acidic dipeptidase